MDGSFLNCDKNPIQDGISRIRFAPESNNLLISSWDTNLRLYDVDRSKLVFEASTEAALLDCCFQGEAAAFNAASDCSIVRHDLHSGVGNFFGKHYDLATSVEYSVETGWNLKVYRIRRLQLALDYLNYQEIEISLEMLAGVSLAEEGVLRLIFAAVYLMLNKGGNDSDVSAASREVPPKIYIHQMEDQYIGSFSAGSSN